ncbi:MAG: endolytic transglycosylase MltG [Gammaproteobacteria bacterium]|nr:endolytic transglycosylase MltG [Gammaproteobacteria bacterium]MYF27579.1 endolytic transglycosylase MltG [Gammaproteobacteria bacterium]MYK46119.1 endolytic transglycosylase MltG [Gammaproteobacteria bacterium]
MNKRILLIPAAAIVLGVAFLVGMGVYLDRWAGRSLPVAEETVVIVAPAMSFTSVADRLAEAGVVDEWLFSLRARQRGLQGSVQSGEYRITSALTPDTLLDRLTRGVVVAHRFLIVEGSTCEAVLARLGSDGRLSFDLTGVGAHELMARLGLPAGNPEGWFFPDTYLFKRDDKASGLLLRANAKMNAVLAEAWSQRSPKVSFDDPYDALILASIIEKETAFPPDRTRIAGVFVRRLAMGMRLQSDPTVIYGLGDAYDGNLTRRMLKTDGPYNTYRRAGLPPSPIALPGRASIEAAMHPGGGDDLYFVARGDGTSEFSKTLDEHNRAVARYQRR